MRILHHLSIGALAHLGSAQAPPPSNPLADQGGSPSFSWQVPLHSVQSAPGESASGDAWWAAGTTDKASFHDGFVFYPALGADYPESLPMRWTTEAITCGGRPVAELAPAPAHHRTAWRYEYRYPGVVEAYDLRADGVEQSFVIAARPHGRGDLVVRGRLTTRLSVDVVPSAEATHTALTLRDDQGRAVARYGEAFAIDANGRRAAIDTACDGEHVTLTVPAAWLDAAAFPVTIDPLTSRAQLTTSGLFDPFWGWMYADMACDEESTTSNLMFVVSVPVSANDATVYAVLCNDDFSNPRTVFTDTALAGTGRPKVAFVAGADRWVIAYEKNTFAQGGGIGLYFHDKGNTVQNSGLIVFRQAPAGTRNWFVDLGGTAANSTGDHALLVYQADTGNTNTANSSVWGTRIDARARTFGTAFRISSTAGNLDCQRPAVNQVTDGGSASWIVVYEQKDNSITNDDYDAMAARVTSAGTVAGTAQVGPDGGPPLHKIFADVAGSGGRYMVSIHQSDERAGGSSQLMVERFDWSETAATPTRIRTRVVVPPADRPQPGQLAFDSLTRSHWALVYAQGVGVQPPQPPQLFVVAWATAAARPSSCAPTPRPTRPSSRRRRPASRSCRGLASSRSSTCSARSARSTCRSASTASACSTPPRRRARCTAPAAAPASSARPGPSPATSSSRCR